MRKTDVNNVILINAKKELSSIAAKGLTNNNLDIAYKLIEMYYRLALIDKMNEPSCTCDFDYMTAKKQYRINSCDVSKEEVIKCLNRKIQSIEEEIKELWNDADFDEERQLLNKLRGG